MKYLRNIHHAGVFIHDDHPAGAHHRAGLGELVKVDRQVQKLFRDAAARRSAGLHGFELLAAGDAAADLDR